MAVMVKPPIEHCINHGETNSEWFCATGSHQTLAAKQQNMNNLHNLWDLCYTW